ncbi:MAG TPA: zinc ribbon domain-containing protein [Gemmatimonadaceae bacterium]|nr:zinc ribbon domain-containing protein [Gemmatimonadaceae bacterium]
MPLYEFRCPQGHDFEKFYRSIGAAVAEEKCPECGVVAARLMSTAGLVFKGSGFYITDYGKDGKKAERDAATAKAAAPKADTASGGDAKPAEAVTKSADSTPAPAAKTAEAKPAPAPAKAEAPSKKAE